MVSRWLRIQDRLYHIFRSRLAINWNEFPFDNTFWRILAILISEIHCFFSNFDSSKYFGLLLKVSSGKHRDKKVLSNLWGWKKKNISLLAASEADSTIILLVFSSYKKILESSQRLWKLCAVRRFCHSTWRVTCSLNETNSWLVSWIFSSSEASVASLVSAENVSIRVDISDNFADYTFSRKKFQHRWKLR